MSATSFLSRPVQVVEDTPEALVRVYGHLPDPRFPKARFPENAAVFLASGAIHKLQDWRRIQRGHAPRLFLINALTALKDSHEEEQNPADIAIGKLDITLGDFREMGQREKEEVFRIAEIESDQQVLEMSEDRYIILDKRLQDYKGFDPFKKLPLVKECFEDKADWPGYRYKELTDAMGGVTEFLRVLEKAYEELPKQDPVKYADLNREHSSGISVALRPHKPGMLPLPEEGIVIEAIEHGLTIKFPTQKDLSELKRKGKLNDVDLSYFEYPAGQRDPSATLRLDNENPYFDETFIAARVWQVLNNLYHIPELAAPRKFDPILLESSKIISNKKVNPRRRPKGVSIEVSNEFKSLAEIEESASGAHGMLLQVPKGMSRDKLKKPHVKSQALKKRVRLNEVNNLLKKVGLLLRFTEAVTQKTLHNRFYAGEPILVERALKPWINPMMKALNDRKAMSLKPSMVFDWVKEVAPNELRQKLLWDPSDYKPPEHMMKPEALSLMDESGLRALTGIDGGRFRLAIIGSASVCIPVALDDTRNVTHAAAKSGMIILDGGGTRTNTVMGAMREGSIAAYEMGYQDFHHIGHVVPLTARREANFGQFREQYGLNPTAGHEDENYFVYNNIFHFVRHETLAQRQHTIEGPAHALVEMAGGAGTNFESLTMAYNNLCVLKNMIKTEKPIGFFPGFHAGLRPIFVVNSLINGVEENGRYSDYKREIFDERELQLMLKSLHNSGCEAVEHIHRFRHDRRSGLRLAA